MDEEVEKIASDIASYSDTVFLEGSEEDNEDKMHIGNVLSVLADAIREGQLASLSKEVEEWGESNLLGRKGSRLPS